MSNDATSGAKAGREYAEKVADLFALQELLARAEPLCATGSAEYRESYDRAARKRARELVFEIERQYSSM